MNTNPPPDHGKVSSDDQNTEPSASTPPSPATLMDAQCWLWGQDLRSPAGNLLAQFGLTRDVYPGEGDHRTHYRGLTAGRCIVIAWSGGVLLGDPATSLFFPRSRFTPLMLPGLHNDDASPDLRGVMTRPHPLAPADHPHILTTLRWLAHYERFVADHGVAGWRAECARRWEQVEDDAHRAAAEVGVEYERLAPLPADGLAGPWERLASDAAMNSRTGRHSTTPSARRS